MNKRKSNQGSSIVEVLAGFSVLMVLMAAAAGVVGVSSKMAINARDILKGRETIQERLYTGMAEEESVLPGARILLVEADEEGRPLSGGAELELDAELKRITDEDSGITVYQIRYSAGVDR